jgi:hypothetical protein
MPNPAFPARQTVPIVDPQYFDVKYAINPLMRDSAGELQIVAKVQARAQWEGLAAAYRKPELALFGC